MKVYYQDSFCTIFHCDCREILPAIGPVDAAIVDPPYGETALAWDVWPEGWPRLLVDVVPQWWCFGSMRMFWGKRDEFSDWKLAQDIVWEKHNGSGIHNDRFRRVHELAVHVYRGKWKALYKKPPIVAIEETRERGRVIRSGKPQHFRQMGTRSDYHFTGKRLMRTVVSVKSCHGYAIHPTQKPEGIIRPLIEYSVAPGASVLDPFMGSGTTLRVAKDLGRKAIGIEIDEKYCEQAAKRLSQEALVL